jgi:tRNA1(Val) A37 N6-methylase TrmN6
MLKTTIDGLLNNRIKFEQPADGYRVAIDTVLLAAAVPAAAGQKVLELGCGVGGAMLALACRVSGIAVTGIEIQSALAHLCAANIECNALAAELRVTEGDATRLPDKMKGAFDHVMMNPPYHDKAHHDVSAHPGKRKANTEEEGDLALWIASAAQALKSGGILTLIHRADRLDEILDKLKEDFGAVWIKPIAPKAGRAPKRVIVRAEKGGNLSQTICSPLILHNADGAFTDETDSILRYIGKMEF